MFAERFRWCGRQGGLTLVELIVFIVIVSVGLAGLLSALNISVLHSADPMVRKQASAIAEGLMEEVALQPFTYCDPTDANVATAAPFRTAGVLNSCTVSGIVKNRYIDDASHTRFNNVNDYNGFAMNGAQTCVGAATGICDINGTNPSPNLTGYTAAVAVTNVGTAFNGSYTHGEALRIDVTVARGNESLTLTSYRFRYAPNSP
jgi:MSHA pilin protein MshD